MHAGNSTEKRKPHQNNPMTFLLERLVCSIRVMLIIHTNILHTPTTNAGHISEREAESKAGTERGNVNSVVPNSYGQ